MKVFCLSLLQGVKNRAVAAVYDRPNLESVNSALIERRYKWPIWFFTPSYTMNV
jgi:hypothetical protein